MFISVWELSAISSTRTSIEFCILEYNLNDVDENEIIGINYGILTEKILNSVIDTHHFVPNVDHSVTLFADEFAMDLFSTKVCTLHSAAAAVMCVYCSGIYILY